MKLRITIAMIGVFAACGPALAQTDDRNGLLLIDEFYYGGMSADGSSFVGRSLDDGGWIWTPFTDRVVLPRPNDDVFFKSTEPRGISDDGRYICGSYVSTEQILKPIYWFADSDPIQLGSLRAGSGGMATDVSNTGVVVGQSDDQAFRWTFLTGMRAIAESRDGLDPVIAEAITADGSVVVGQGNYPRQLGSEQRAFAAASSTRILPTLARNEAANDVAYGVNANGNVIVGASGGVDDARPALWYGGQVRSLGSFNGITEGAAFAVSDDGCVVGGALFPNGPLGAGQAFVWTPATGMLDLQDLVVNQMGVDLEGWSLNTVEDVSSDGTVISGSAYRLSPEARSVYRLVLPPLPPSVKADVTTTGATIPGFAGFGVRDAVVDLDDLGAFLDAWLVGKP